MRIKMAQTSRVCSNFWRSKRPRPQSPSGICLSLGITCDSVVAVRVIRGGGHVDGGEPARYERKGLRYPSDLTDEEWALIEPHPAAASASVSRRALLNGILYVLTTGCQWRQLPKDFPPKSTDARLFRRAGSCDGVLDAHPSRALCQVRELEGRAPTPTLAIVDSQSVKSAEKGGQRIDSAGYDAGKKIKGKKRHMRRSIRSAC